MRLLHFVLTALLLFGGISQTAKAAPNQRPTASVTDNTRADSLGIFANNQSGIAMCWERLSAGTARFYRPTDVRGHDASARTAPLEADTCARMRVRGGLLGVVALREGSLVNLGQRDGREQPVAYNMCNNYLELLARPTIDAAVAQPEQVTLPRTELTITTEQTEPQRVRQEEVVEVQRVIVYRYLPDIIEGQQPPPIDVILPAPVHRRITQTVIVPVQREQQRCVCYRPQNDPTAILYRYRYPDGNLYCVPRYMGERTQYPPGYGMNP